MFNQERSDDCVVGGARLNFADKMGVVGLWFGCGQRRYQLNFCLNSLLPIEAKFGGRCDTHRTPIRYARVFNNYLCRKVGLFGKQGFQITGYDNGAK
jgi:hypothetical protein